GDLGGQARLQPAEFMRTLAVEAEGMRELLIHRLDDLPHPSHSAPEPLGPRRLTVPFGWADDLGSLDSPPGSLLGLSLDALVDHVGSTGRGAYTCQAWVGLATQCKERVCGGLIFGTRRTNAEAGDHPAGVDRQEQMEALIPAQPVAPANSRQA